MAKKEFLKLFKNTEEKEEFNKIVEFIELHSRYTFDLGRPIEDVWDAFDSMIVESPDKKNKLIECEKDCVTLFIRNLLSLLYNKQHKLKEEMKQRKYDVQKLANQLSLKVACKRVIKLMILANVIPKAERNFSTIGIIPELNELNQAVEAALTGLRNQENIAIILTPPNQAELEYKFIQASIGKLWRLIDYLIQQESKNINTYQLLNRFSSRLLKGKFLAKIDIDLLRIYSFYVDKIDKAVNELAGNSRLNAQDIVFYFEESNKWIFDIIFSKIIRGQNLVMDSSIRQDVTDCLDLFLKKFEFCTKVNGMYNVIYGIISKDNNDLSYGYISSLNTYVDLYLMVGGTEDQFIKEVTNGIPKKYWRVQYSEQLDLIRNEIFNGDDITGIKLEIKDQMYKRHTL